MNAKTDSLKFGAFLGLLIPAVTFFFFYLYNIKDFGHISHFFGFLDRSGLFTKLASLSVIPNLLIFFVFIRNEALLSARGVLMATFIWAAVIVSVYYLI